MDTPVTEIGETDLNPSNVDENVPIMPTNYFFQNLSEQSTQLTVIENGPELSTMPASTNIAKVGDNLDDHHSDIFDLFCDYQQTRLSHNLTTNDLSYAINDEQNRGMQEIISYLEEGAPQSITDTTESSSGDPVYFDVNMPNNSDFNPNSMLNSTFMPIVDDADPVVRLPPINNDFHQGFQHFSDEIIFEGTGSVATISQNRKHSKIPVALHHLNLKKKPKRTSTPRCVEEKFKQISNTESSLLLIPIVTRTSCGGSTTNIMGNSITEQNLNANFKNISLNTEVLSKINDLSEGKNIVQVSTSSASSRNTPPEIPTMSPFQTKRTQQEAEVQKQIDQYAKETSELVEQLTIIENSDIQVPVITPVRSKERKQQLKPIQLLDDHMIFLANNSSLSTPNFEMTDPLREQETSHKSAKSAGSKQSQRRRLRKDHGIMKDLTQLTFNLSPIASGNKDPVADDGSRRGSLRSSHKIQPTPLTIDFAKVVVVEEEVEASIKVECETCQQVVRSPRSESRSSQTVEFKPEEEKQVPNHADDDLSESNPPNATQSTVTSSTSSMLFCQLCSKPFNYKHHLARHMSFHKKNQHTCKWCLKQFAKLEMLKNHIKYHCDKIDGFKRKRAYTPTDGDGKKVRFSCGICKNYTTNSKVLLKKHEYRMHERVALKAIKKNNATPARPVVKTGPRRISLRLAMSGIKSAKKRIRCSKCKDVFDSWDKFDEHSCCLSVETKRRLFE